LHVHIHGVWWAGDLASAGGSLEQGRDEPAFGADEGGLEAVGQPRVAAKIS